MYNTVLIGLYPVELPLVADRIKLMDTTLSPGILTRKWKEPSNVINEFIDKAHFVVSEVH